VAPFNIQIVKSGYSDEDERKLQMYQEKLLRESLDMARTTYLSLTDLLLYKLNQLQLGDDKGYACQPEGSWDSEPSL
jgi:hypothetical protein